MDLIGNSDIKRYYDEETKVIKMPGYDLDLEVPQGLGYVLYNSFKEHFGKTALVDLNAKQTISYEDLLKLSTRTAIKLRALNLKPGDIITIFSDNQIDSIAVFFAAFFCGIVNANLDPKLPDEDLAHLLPQVETRLYFVSEECEQRLERILGEIGVKAEIVVFGKSERNLLYEDFVCEQEDEAGFRVYESEDLDEMCLMLFSSGTTGFPKGMVFSQRCFVFHSYFNVGFVKNSMSVANIYWIGPVQTALSQIRCGGVFTFTSKFSPAEHWNDIKTYNIDLIQLHPHAAMEFIQNKPENWDGKLAGIALVGSAISDSNLIKLREALPGTAIFPVYGMSETVSLLIPDIYGSDGKLGSAGIPKRNIHYKIVDLNTEENLSYNQPGELRVKSKYQLTSYYKIDSTDIRDADGFLKTGDIAYYDQDFCFYIVDRVKHIFKYKGVHINPAKYEKVLEAHPDIKTGVLVGVPHETEGAHIVAVVVLEKGRSLSAGEVEEFYNGKVIDAARIRAGVRFMERIPMTETGKIMRHKLRDLILRENLDKK